MSDVIGLDRVTVIGLGLIGGSVARGLTRAGFTGECVGVVATPDEASLARDLAIADRIETDVAAAVAGADLVIVAVPLGAVDDVFDALAPAIDEACVITDVGSAKTGVMASARQRLGDAYRRFVPGHPIAGTEQNGPAAGFDSLFDGRRVVLTPDRNVDEYAIDRIMALWKTLGAHVVRLDAHDHDRLLAATSHLPHALAFTLVDALTCGDDAEAVFDYAAGGFADFTRIAASDPVVWRDIFAANRDAVVAALDAYAERLADMRREIAGDDGAAVLQRLTRAKTARDHLPVAARRG